MGKKKRRGKQKTQNQQQDDVKPTTATLPVYDIPNISSERTEDIPPVIKDSLRADSKKDQQSNSQENKIILPNPESEELMLNLSIEEKDRATPQGFNKTDLKPEIEMQKSQENSSFLGMKEFDISDNSAVENVESISMLQGSSQLKNVKNTEVQNESLGQVQASIQDENLAEYDTKETENSVEQSSGKETMNINDCGTSLNSPPEMSIPSSNTYPIIASAISHEESKVEEGRQIKCMEKSFMQKSTKKSKNSGLDEKSFSIQEKINAEIDSKQNTDDATPDSTVDLDVQIDQDKKDLSSSLYNTVVKEEADNFQKENGKKQLNAEQQAVSEINFNTPFISTLTDSKKSSKRNKKSDATKKKVLGRMDIEENKTFLLECSQLSNIDDINQEEIVENKGRGRENKNMRNSNMEKIEENTKLKEKDHKVKNVENYVTAKDEKMKIAPASKIKKSSQSAMEGSEIEMPVNVSSQKEDEINQIKGENNNKLSTNTTTTVKHISKPIDLSNERGQGSQTIVRPSSKETDPGKKSLLKNEPDVEADFRSSELCIQVPDKESSNHLNLKGNAEATKIQPKHITNDKYKNIAEMNPTQKQSTMTDVRESHVQSETVLDSFVDTSLNTMLSKTKKGMSKQRINNSNRDPETEKNSQKRHSTVAKHDEGKNLEEVINEDSPKGNLQQIERTSNTRTKNSVGDNTATHANDAETNFVNADVTGSYSKISKGDEGLSLLHIEGRIPVRTLFMANTCHICKLTHGGSTRLQTCSVCRMITYCSREHQKKHWKEHKSICKVIQIMVQQRGLPDLYCNAHSITNADEWRKFRCMLLVEAENLAGRSLLPYEREMFIYPRICGKCHKSDPEKLKVCKSCHYINFCCNEHLPHDHHIWCKDLKLLLEINQYQSFYGLIKPFIPNFQLSESKIFSKSMKDFILTYISREKKFDFYNIYEAALSEVASCPLTILYAINYLMEKNLFSASKKELKIHLVGAENQFEADLLSKWDSFLLNLLQNVVKLHIILIGPELTSNMTNITNSNNHEIKNINTLDPSKQLVVEFHYQKLYHEYATEKIFTKPDIICAFNCGIYRFTGFDKQDTWGPTLSAMLKYPNTPIILTAYTAVEAPKDVERFQNQFKINILHNTSRNPFSSMRPNLNFVSDDETPVIFKNQYLSIIAKGD